MESSRRTFLKKTGLCLASMVAPLRASSSPSEESVLAIPFERVDGMKGKTYGILIASSQKGPRDIIPVPFNVHIVIPVKNRRNTVLAPNKYGNSFLEIDITKNLILKDHKVKNDIVLSGHMAFSDNNKYLCATAMDQRRNDQNCVVFFNPESFAVIDVVYLDKPSPSYHDCRFLPNSTTLVLTGGSGAVFLETKSKKIVRHRFETKDKSSQIRHFSLSSQGAMCAQANKINMEAEEWRYSSAGIVTLLNSDQHFIDLGAVDKTLSEAELLDFSFDNEGVIFAAVHGKIDRVSFWNFKEHRLLKVMKLEGATRIAMNPSGNNFTVISHDTLFIIDAHTFELRSSRPTGLVGSRMTLGHKSFV